MRIIFVVFWMTAFPLLLNAQNEYERWNEKETMLTSLSPAAVSTTPANKSGASVINSIQKLYKVLISDHDGDNCPFYPTCSSFAVRAVETGGLIQGSLMFADRFMRDANLFNRAEYQTGKNGRLFDPPELYLLTQPLKNK